MPGLLLHVGATVLCAHGGQAQPTAPNPRVKVHGAAGGHAGRAPMSSAAVRTPCRRLSTGPCVIGQWVTAATRVTVHGAAGAVAGAARPLCTPTGTPADHCCHADTRARDMRGVHGGHLSGAGLAMARCSLDDGQAYGHESRRRCTCARPSG